MHGSDSNFDKTTGESQSPTMRENAFQCEIHLDQMKGKLQDLLQAKGEVHTPDRQPDERTRDGARIWEHNGKISCIKNAAGEIYNFQFDASGKLSSMTEPDGSVLTRKSDDSWLRVNTWGYEHTFNGNIRVGKDGSVTYAGAGGQDTIHAANGSSVERETVDGQKRVSKVTFKGHSTEISYDAENNPFAIKNADGSSYLKGIDNNWYKNPGNGHNKYVDNKFVREADGTVKQLDSKGKVVTTFDTTGKH